MVNRASESIQFLSPGKLSYELFRFLLYPFGGGLAGGQPSDGSLRFSEELCRPTDLWRIKSRSEIEKLRDSFSELPVTLELTEEVVQLVREFLPIGVRNYVLVLLRFLLDVLKGFELKTNLVRLALQSTHHRFLSFISSLFHSFLLSFLQHVFQRTFHVLFKHVLPDSESRNQCRTEFVRPEKFRYEDFR